MHYHYTRTWVVHCAWLCPLPARPVQEVAAAAAAPRAVGVGPVDGRVPRADLQQPARTAPPPEELEALDGRGPALG